MLSNPIKFSSRDQIKEFLDLLSSDELKNLSDYINGRVSECENPEIRELAENVYNITNYVGGAINIKKDKLSNVLESYTGTAL